MCSYSAHNVSFLWKSKIIQLHIKKGFLFSGNILGLEGKVDTTLANVDHLMSNSASNERKFDDLETAHLDIKSKFCILHKLQ